MKSVIKLVWFTTAVVFTTAILAQTKTAPGLLSVLMVIGPPLIIFMVIRVLQDKHRDNLTFDDWYRDRPRKR